MITIGLTGWSDHPLIQRNRSKKLEEYASHFPVVELDTPFYAIPSVANTLSWAKKTPTGFSFIPKVYSKMTLHQPFSPEFDSMKEVYDAYLNAMTPLIEADKIAAFLFQFPPYMECTRQNVNYLKYIKAHMKNLPVAVEFRHPSWFTEKTKDKTLQLLSELEFSHVVVDQPQTPHNSVPQVVASTASQLSIIRLHGRNYEGWAGGKEVQNWRVQRTLYDYSDNELLEFKGYVEELRQKSSHVSVIFNNNSGGHAAKNAKRLQELLGLSFDYLGPRQLDLF